MTDPDHAKRDRVVEKHAGEGALDKLTGEVVFLAEVPRQEFFGPRVAAAEADVRGSGVAQGDGVARPDRATAPPHHPPSPSPRPAQPRSRSPSSCAPWTILPKTIRTCSKLGNTFGIGGDPERCGPSRDRANSRAPFWWLRRRPLLLVWQLPSSHRLQPLHEPRRLDHPNPRLEVLLRSVPEPALAHLVHQPVRGAVR